MESAKIVTILLGSPRVGGNTECLADAFAKSAEAKGYEVRKVRSASMNLKGCRDCRLCWSMGKPCVQNDDMDSVYRDIEEASVLVFVSPLYYYSWTTQIKPIWDRLIPYNMQGALRRISGKEAILLSAAGDTEESKFDGLLYSFKFAAEYMKWEIIGSVCAPDIYTKGEMAEKGSCWLNKASLLADKL